MGTHSIRFGCTKQPKNVEIIYIEKQLILHDFIYVRSFACHTESAVCLTMYHMRARGCINPFPFNTYPCLSLLCIHLITIFQGIYIRIYPYKRDVYQIS